MKTSKVLVSSGVVAIIAALALAAAGAQALDTANQNNSNTGPNPLNRNKIKIHRSANKHIRTRATANNNATVNGSTGGNSSHHNTSGGGIGTGAVDVTGAIENTLNGNGTCAACCDQHAPAMDSDITQSNDTTGPDSINKNKVKIKDNNDVHCKTKATANNSVVVNGSTGGNTSHHNTMSGDITTGDVNANLTFTNTLN